MSARRPETNLPENVRGLLRTVRAGQRDQDLAAVAETLAQNGPAAELLGQLAAEPDPLARHLAMLLAVRQPGLVEPGIIRGLRRLLFDKAMPADLQLSLAAALVRVTGTEGRPALSILGALVSGLGKIESVERLRHLELQIGPCPAIDQMCARLDVLIKITCPRCGLRLPRNEMNEHLWTEHRLLLDGLRVREPWKLIDDWIESYYLEGDPLQLARCQELARKLDPERGLRRVQRLLLAHGVEDDQARRDLMAEAALRRASICPGCYALAPLPEEVVPRGLNLSHGRLTTLGYRVEVSERGLFSSLEIETPEGVVQRDLEPGRALTAKGATVLVAGPLVLLALALAFALSVLRVPPLGPVTILLTIALATGLAVRLFLWWTNRRLEDRVVDYAWALLVPRLHGETFSDQDSAFLAGLALTSAEGYGRPEARAPVLAKVLAYTGKAAQAGAAPATHLAALWRLNIEDTAARGLDVVPLLVAQAGRCFEGKVPLAFAEQLFSGPSRPWMTPGNVARLRVLLCNRAFEAGLELANLLEVGRGAPALGAALQTDDVKGLAHLRLLWSMRPRRPWDDGPPAATVFELAEEAANDALLEDYPDLLLAGLTRPPVYLSVRGLIFQGAVFTEPLRVIEVKARRLSLTGGYDLILGDHRFWFRDDPDELAARLERWGRFFFNEFVPYTAAVHDWKARGIVTVAREVVTCPECRRKLLARSGEMGLPVEHQ